MINPLEASEIQSIRHRLDCSPPVLYLDPPYHVAASTRLTVLEKLQYIQNYIQRLEYNYTGMQFFDLNAARPLYGLMNSARQMWALERALFSWQVVLQFRMTESLPIKCFEAFLVAIYLTTGILGLDRFNVSFKTCFNSIVYRHVVLGVKYGPTYGALGLSRRDDLYYKPLTGKYDSLSSLIDDFVRSYQTYGHQILRVTIGLPIIHDLTSFLTINWQTLTIDPTEMQKSVYDRELDRIVRIWNQVDVHMTYRSVGPLSSLIQPRESSPNRFQPSRFRNNRQRSVQERPSTMLKGKTHEKQTGAQDQSSVYAIRV